MDTANTTTGTSIIDKVKNGAKKLMETVAGFIMPGYSSPKNLGSDIIKSIERVAFAEKVVSPKGPTPLEIIVICIEELCKMAAKHNRSIRIEWGLIYNGIYWQLMNEGETKHFLGRVAEKMGVNEHTAKHHATIDQLYKQLLCAAYATPMEQDKSKVLINVLNGTLHVTSEGVSLRKHNPDDNLKYVINYEYLEDAERPTVQAFLDRVMPDKECQALLLDTLGYTFVPGLKLEEMLLLHGDGQDGKSVIFDLTVHLLGARNVSHYSLRDLSRDTKYCRADFVNKTLNYGSDIGMKGINEAEFKKIVSREPISYRAIFKNPFETANIPPLIFNTNSIPSPSPGQEKSMSRRMNIIPMTNPISDEEVDKNYAKKIYEKDAEMQGFLKLVVKGAARVQKHQRLSPCKASEDFIRDLMEDFDSVTSFIKSNGYAPGFEATKKRTTMFEEYRNFCCQNGYDSSMGPIVFSRKLKTKGFEIRKAKGGAEAQEVHYKIERN